jgi:hypothetical protein
LGGQLNTANDRILTFEVVTGDSVTGQAQRIPVIVR